MNPRVNFGLSVTMMCNVGSSIANKCTSLVEDVGNGEVYECVGQGICEKFLYLLLNFALNLKLLQEKNILNKTKHPFIIHSSVGQKSEYGMTEYGCKGLQRYRQGIKEAILFIWILWGSIFFQVQAGCFAEISFVQLLD